MKDVFISYRRVQGEEIAQSLYRFLDSKGLRVYFDKIDMQDGKPFPSQLESALKTAPNYVLIVTQNVFTHGSEERDWVWREIELALKEYKKSPLERTLTVVVPYGVEIPMWEDLPEEIRDIADVQRIGQRTEQIDLPIGNVWNIEFERVFVAVTELNRRNLWYAAHRWLENSKRPGGRFASLHIEESIMPDASLQKSANLPVNVSMEQNSSYESKKPLLDVLSETKGNLYLIGQGGIGKTTALMSIMNHAYENSAYTEKAQIPIFVELSFAPDSSFGKIYEDGVSTFIRRSIFRQVRMNQTIRQVGSEEIDDLKELFQLPYELAVKPITDLLNKEKPAPEYLLLLDGLNEVSIREIELETSDCSGKIKTSIYRMIWREIEWIADNCPNVRIILTSRSDEDALDNITRLYLNELSGSVVIDYLINGNVAPTQVEKVQKDSVLLETLRIPLFLTMYTALENKSEATAAGEILKAFFHERRKNIEKYTIKSRLDEIHKNLGETSAHDLVGRITPEMYSFILDFILPEIAWNMEREGEFYLNKIKIKKYIEPVLSNFDDLSICGDYGQEAFEDLKITDARVHTKTTANKWLELSADFAVVNEIIINICANAFGILQKTGTRYGFIHQHIRDYFAAIKNINTMRLSVYMFEEDEKELALECINRAFKDEPISVSVRRFVGEYLGEHKNRPYFADEKWNYGVPDHLCDRSILSRVLNVFRCCNSPDYGHAIYSIISILKETRYDLSGENLSYLDLTKIDLSNHINGKQTLSTNFTGTLLSKYTLCGFFISDKIENVFLTKDEKEVVVFTSGCFICKFDFKTFSYLEQMQKRQWLSLDPSVISLENNMDLIQVEPNELDGFGELYGFDEPYVFFGKKIVVNYENDIGAIIYEEERIIRIFNVTDFSDRHIIEIKHNIRNIRIKLLNSRYLFLIYDDNSIDVVRLGDFSVYSKLKNHISQVANLKSAIDIFPGKFIALITSKGNIEIRDYHSLILKSALFDEMRFVALRILQTKRKIAVATKDGRVKILSSDTFSEILIYRFNEDICQKILLTSDECFMIFIGYKTIVIFDTCTNHVIKNYFIKEIDEKYEISTAVLSVDNEHLFLILKSKTCDIGGSSYSFQSGKIVRFSIRDSTFIMSKKYFLSIQDCCENTNNDTVGIILRDGEIELLDSNTLTTIKHLSGEGLSGIGGEKYISFIENQIVVSANGQISCYSAENLDLIKTYSCKENSILICDNNGMTFLADEKNLNVVNTTKKHVVYGAIDNCYINTKMSRSCFHNDCFDGTLDLLKEYGAVID